MWHEIPPKHSGAASDAAPLLIRGIRLRFHWERIEIEEPDLVGKLDTGAFITIIPLDKAIKMRLPSAGEFKEFRCFDHSVQMPSYPKFNTEIFIPKLGWQIRTVAACQRDTVLLGRDLCSEMLLVANWRSRGFGIRPAKTLHRTLRLFFHGVGNRVKP
jgi:hypothetical protein